MQLVPLSLEIVIEYTSHLPHIMGAVKLWIAKIVTQAFKSLSLSIVEEHTLESNILELLQSVFLHRKYNLYMIFFLIL